MENGSNGSNKTRRDRAAETPYTPDYESPRRRPVEDRAEAFNTLAWIVEGATGLVEELRHNDLGLSEDFWVHFYAARRESLLAARALIDSLIEQTEQETRKAQEQAQRRARRGGVAVDF